MNELERFLKTDPRDALCGQTMEILHVYVEETAAGVDADALHPEVAAHLESCPPCAEDCEGLRAAVGDE
jgi:hypothetical protein